MSEDQAAPDAEPRSFLRRKLRHATFILPRTGQRAKGHVNLSPDDEQPEQDFDDERAPLLPQVESRNERPGTAAKWRAGIIGYYHAAHAFAVSETGKGVMKCSLAYVLGTLATFVPAISGLLGRQDGKHMVATITVYFHPARTRGSMFRALICAALAFIYAAFISVTSMMVSVFFEDTLHLLPLGHAIILIVFCGGGLGFVGWVKLRRGDALVNVACSLTSLAIITVLTKEGAVQQGDLSFAKISQVLKMVLMGVVATMAVCFLVFPLSARAKLRQVIIDETDSLSEMLGIITESFLEGSSEKLEQRRFLNAANKNKKAYTAIDRLLQEAKLEHYFAGREKEYRLEKRMARCLQDIAQSVGGLRSAAALQFDLLKQSNASGETTLYPQYSRGGFTSSLTSSIFSPYKDMDASPFCEPPSNQLGTPEAAMATPGSASLGGKSGSENLTPADIFEKFIFHLGPSMRSLVFTLKEILAELPYGPAPDFKVTVNSKFRISLDRALGLYRNARNDALKWIYWHKDLAKAKSVEIEADLEEVAASCGHFSFSLQEFSEQLKEFLDVLDELQLEVEERPNGRTWNWIKVWRTIKDSNSSIGIPMPSSGDNGDMDATNVIDPGDGAPRGITAIVSGPREDLRYRLWKALHIFRREDTKFAIKVGAGAALYALPSFLAATRPIYSHWRGEWGLLSYMLVCSMTIGASNTTGYARFLGTSLGAICGIAAWSITKANVYALVVSGWFMAFCTAYIILARGQGPMGRFIMLTYNLVVLYAYSLSHKDNDDDQDEGGTTPIIADIALHRVVSVLSGIIWGIIITRVIWPISARRKLKDGLSLLWLKLSVIWRRDPLSTMAQGRVSTVYFTPREKLELQRYLARLETLRNAARSEFELMGPFPDAAYEALIGHSRRILDAFQAMNVEIVKNLTASEGEAAMLEYTIVERKQLSLRISHLLTVIASSMRLEYPLDDALPNTEHARDRLLARLHRFRKDSSASRHTTDEDYALLYAYALVTGQLSNEIMAMIAEVGKLFGILNEDALKLE